MPIKLSDKKIFLVALIIMVHLTFSYYFIPKYWSASIGFVFILILSFVTWKKKFANWTGIYIRPKELILTILVAIVFLSGSTFIIKILARGNNIQFQPGNYKDILHTLFYSLNEEIIMGALLLKGIKSKWRNVKDWKISIIVALCFSIIHYVFFRWIFLSTGDLNFIILLTLFCVGILRNNLILTTGHIGYSWAIHFAWVFPMLGCQHFNILNNYYLTDFERFEIYLGDYRTAIITALLAIISFFLLNKKLLLPDNSHTIANR